MMKKCELWLKEAEKMQPEETEKQHHVIVTENIFLKVLLKKVFKITIESSPARFPI